MNRVLSNIFKGLLVAFVLVVIGGVIVLNIRTNPNTSMVLVSSSLVNSIKTENKKIDSKTETVSKEENEEIKENLDNKDEEKKETEEIKEEVKEEKKEEVKEEVKIEEKKEPEPVKQEEVPVKQEETKPSVPNVNGSYAPSTTSGDSNFTYQGYVTAYGPDCYGCYGSMTAMGDYVGEGNIYYNHPTYGTIRIVAGDKDLLNKVVRITGLNISTEPVIAIVRDTGGDIGRNKPKNIVLDLLYTSEKSSEVLHFGKQWATVEVLN